MKRILAALATTFLLPFAHSAVVYDTWSSNEGPSGNYILTVSENSGALNFHLTVSPWNAEALGLFVDLGNISVGMTSLSSVVPSGQVSIYATDTTSNSCGNGCNLNGTGLTNEWELVFRLGAQGFDSIQTFSFTVSSNSIAFTESMLGTVGIRAQQLCTDAGETLPTCNPQGSDKAWGTGRLLVTEQLDVPEPGIVGLLGLGAIALSFAGAIRRRP